MTYKYIDQPHLLAEALQSIEERDIGEQDARGWNKCIKAIWGRYEKLCKGDKLNTNQNVEEDTTTKSNSLISKNG